MFFLPHAYASYRVTDLVGVGVGFNSPFGLSLRWPETSPGRAIVRDIELRSYFVSAVAALDLSRWVPARGCRSAEGSIWVPATLRLERDILAGGIAVGSPQADGQRIRRRRVAGRNLYRPPALDFLAFGVTYRSPSSSTSTATPPSWRARRSGRACRRTAPPTRRSPFLRSSTSASRRTSSPSGSSSSTSTGPTGPRSKASSSSCPPTRGSSRTELARHRHPAGRNRSDARLGRVAPRRVRLATNAGATDDARLPAPGCRPDRPRRRRGRGHRALVTRQSRGALRTSHASDDVARRSDASAHQGHVRSLGVRGLDYRRHKIESL